MTTLEVEKCDAEKILQTDKNNSWRLSWCVAESINGVNKIELLFTHYFDINL